METANIGLLIYWLAISGFGTVTVTHSGFNKLELGDQTIETYSGGGGLVDSRAISWSRDTYRVDLWWEPPFTRRIRPAGDYTDHRWHLKTLLDIKGRDEARAQINGLVSGGTRTVVD